MALYQILLFHHGSGTTWRGQLNVDVVQGRGALHLLVHGGDA
jgi:hypothetical protein